MAALARVELNAGAIHAAINQGALLAAADGVTATTRYLRAAHLAR